MQCCEWYNARFAPVVFGTTNGAVSTTASVTAVTAGAAVEAAEWQSYEQDQQYAWQAYGDGEIQYSQEEQQAWQEQEQPDQYTSWWQGEGGGQEQEQDVW
jgi:hypothetical protein